MGVAIGVGVKMELRTRALFQGLYRWDLCLTDVMPFVGRPGLRINLD
jgi:hypothetical protein